MFNGFFLTDSSLPYDSLEPLVSRTVKNLLLGEHWGKVALKTDRLWFIEDKDNFINSLFLENVGCEEQHGINTPCRGKLNMQTQSKHEKNGTQVSVVFPNQELWCCPQDAPVKSFWCFQGN